VQRDLHEEPIRFLTDLILHDGSFYDLLYGGHVFLNARLANHYGFKLPAGADQGWRRHDASGLPDRGGILGMGAFLIQNAHGQRSSPVKRGHWLVTKVLGEHIPPPPPDVPELPESETDLGELTLAQTLAKHRDLPACIGCHQRFDGYGVVFEGIDPIGRSREKDLAGRPIERQAELPDGSRIAGIPALRQHLRHVRHREFVRQLARQVLAYGLERMPIISDDPLLADLERTLEANGGAIAATLLRLIESPQFSSSRGRDHRDP
jgi:Protein of unknown function (DUF1588)/Protein of unknown function (DUF1585)/Protein of unknown function (DUF1592)